MCAFSTDVTMPFQAKDSVESHPASSSYCDSEATVGDDDTAVAGMFDKVCLADTSERSPSSHVTAEEIIKHASETAALKQFSGSLLMTNSAEAVPTAEIPYRDSEIDGAEDSRDNTCEETEPACSSEIRDPQLKVVMNAAEDSSYTAVATSVAQKTVAVSALPLGVYVTKPTAPTDSQAAAGDDADSDAQQHPHDSRRVQLQKQFPILLDLSQRQQQS